MNLAKSHVFNACAISVSIFVYVSVLVPVPVFGSYGFSAFVLISKLYFNTLKGTDIVYWFQYINTLHIAEYCTTSNEFDINGFYRSYIFHTTNIEIIFASNVYRCTCKYLSCRLYFNK